MFARICCRFRRIWPPVTDYIRPSYHTGGRNQHLRFLARNVVKDDRFVHSAVKMLAQFRQLQALICSHCPLLYRWKLSKCYSWMICTSFLCSLHPHTFTCSETSYSLLRICLCSDRGYAFLLWSQRCARRKHL